MVPTSMFWLKQLGRLSSVWPPFAPTGFFNSGHCLNGKVVDKIKAVIGAIDSSMLATLTKPLRISEAKWPEQEWKLVPRRAVADGFGKLSTLAGIGVKYAQETGGVSTDARQVLYKVAAITKEKRNVMVIVPFNLEQVDHDVTKSLRDFGMDLNASLNLLVDFSQQVSALAKWCAAYPDVQPTSSTSPGAMALPPALDVEIWARAQADYHSYLYYLSSARALSKHPGGPQGGMAIIHPDHHALSKLD